jgi:hypothetical protein
MQTFENKSGVMCVTDPCYEKGTWCAVWDLPVLKGTWHTDVVISDEGEWGNRVAKLEVWHEDYPCMFEPLEAISTDIGVDSGQAGFFDADLYPEDDKQFEYENESSFYRRVCNLTLSNDKYGVIDDFGVVSCSGYGDGSYGLFGQADEWGRYVHLAILFLEEDNGEAGDNDDEGDEE